MSLYRRGSVWWIRFTLPNGHELRETTRTADKRQAQEYHDRRKADCWRILQLGERPVYTWRQAVVRWLDEHPHHRSLKNILGYLRQLDPFLGNLTLAQIQRDHFERFIQQRQREGAAPATINRALATARAILHAAQKQWDWIDHVPSVRLLKEPLQRIRWLTHAEAERLLQELPSHLAAMMRFTLATGLRETNVTQLRWTQIDLAQHRCWINAEQSKTRKALAVPLNTEAMRVLQEQQGQHPDFVFVFRGEPVTRANNHAWRKAVQRAGLQDFRWHDLRHTWASWAIQNGVPLEAVQRLVGWSQITMVLRYAHLGDTHLADYAQRVSHDFRHSVDEKPS